ncbi:hypothetical protein LJC18_00535 [Lachnospiraceae bacterium OttesenSCG-928-E19]|nr:hypothetical protein [Lachnospiraceae bacterium OttesenSCG-928-E19]
MFGERCQLCGGKIHAGQCVDCGMKKEQPKIKQVSREKTSTIKERPKLQKKTIKKSGRLKFALGILALLYTIGINIFESVEERHAAKQNEIATEFELSMNPVLLPILPQTEETYEARLEEGVFHVGVELPAGTYRIHEVSGAGSMIWSDKKNDVYETWFLEEGQQSEMESMQLHEGAEITIEEGVSVRFVTNNAQPGDDSFYINFE